MLNQATLYHLRFKKRKRKKVTDVRKKKVLICENWAKSYDCRSSNQMYFLERNNFYQSSPLWSQLPCERQCTEYIVTALKHMTSSCKRFLDPGGPLAVGLWGSQVTSMCCIQVGHKDLCHAFFFLLFFPWSPSTCNLKGKQGRKIIAPHIVCVLGMEESSKFTLRLCLLPLWAWCL